MGPDDGEPPAPRRRRRVLIVRLDSLGDFLLWLPAAQRLREHLPARTHTLTLLGSAVWNELAEQIPYWDRVWAIDRQRFLSERFYRMQWQARLRLTRFDAVVHPTYSREWWVDDGIVRRTRAQERIGFSCDLSNISAEQQVAGDRAYTRLVPATAGPLHELDRNAEFVRCLTGDPRPLAGAALRIAAAGVERELPAPYFVVAPGTGWGPRRWPAAKFSSVIDRVAAKFCLTPVIVGDARDGPIAQEIISKVHSEVVNRVGRTTLPELAALLGKARVVLASDSGPLHLAALQRIPSVVAVGGGHFGRFLPYPPSWHDRYALPRVANVAMPCYQCNWRCIYPLSAGESVPCVEQVSIDAVWREIEGLLINSAKASEKARA